MDVNDASYGGPHEDTFEPDPPPRPSAAASRAQERLEQRMRDAGARLGEAAERLEEIADERLGGLGGPGERAGRAVHRVAGSIDSMAGYLREGDLETVRRDLERRVRERPLQSLLLGVAGGWLLGKILR